MAEPLKRQIYLLSPLYKRSQTSPQSFLPPTLQLQTQVALNATLSKINLFHGGLLPRPTKHRITENLHDLVRGQLVVAALLGLVRHFQGSLGRLWAQGSLKLLLALEPLQKLLILELGLEGIEDIGLGAEKPVDLVSMGLLICRPLLVHKLDLIIRSSFTTLDQYPLLSTKTLKALQNQPLRLIDLHCAIVVTLETRKQAVQVACRNGQITSGKFSKRSVSTSSQQQSPQERTKSHCKQDLGPFNSGASSHRRVMTRLSARLAGANTRQTALSILNELEHYLQDCLFDSVLESLILTPSFYDTLSTNLNRETQKRFRLFLQLDPPALPVDRTHPSASTFSENQRPTPHPSPLPSTFQLVPTLQDSSSLDREQAHNRVIYIKTGQQFPCCPSSPTNCPHQS